MEHVLLGRSGLRASRLCLGTMLFGDSRHYGSSADASREIFKPEKDFFPRRGEVPNMEVIKINAIGIKTPETSFPHDFLRSQYIQSILRGGEGSNLRMRCDLDHEIQDVPLPSGNFSN